MIYLLKRKNDHGCDEYDAKVVRAQSEQEARDIANLNTGEEGKLWTDPQQVNCSPVDPEGASLEILGSFNAG